MKPLSSGIGTTTITFSLPEDLHETLRAVVEGTTASVSGALRWGAMLVIENMGLELPSSVARFRRAPLGGQARRSHHKTGPDFAIIHFNDPAVYAALVQRAARHNGDVGEAAYEFMVAGIKRDAEGNDAAVHN